MDLTIASLVLVSAALHPWRDFFIKGSAYPEGMCLAVMAAMIALSASHAAILGTDLMSIRAVWPLALASGLGFVIYFSFVVMTLREGDLSSYYPITRASPLFIVVFSYLFLEQRYTWPLLLGIVMVFIGAFFLQYRRHSGLFAQPKTLFVAVLAMVVHGLITIVDARAVQVVEPMVQFFWVSLVAIVPSAVVFTIYKPKNRTTTEHLFAGWWHSPVSFLISGISAYVSYILMLSAFQLGGNVAALSAARQASIPISVLIGGLLLKEINTLGRLTWSLILALGIAVIILVT
jgi:drug/metabolite transporter (DMT)-like permease